MVFPQRAQFPETTDDDPPHGGRVPSGWADRPRRAGAAANSGWRGRRRGGTVLLLALACAGCQSKPAFPPGFEPILPRFLLEANPAAAGAPIVQLPTSGVRIPVFPNPVLTEAQFANVELVRVDLGLCLMFECTTTGARNLLQVSGSNLGRRLVLTLNAAPFGARVIDGPITDGRLFIFVEMPDEQLTAAAVDLQRTLQEVQAAIARGAP